MYYSDPPTSPSSLRVCVSFPRCSHCFLKIVQTCTRSTGGNHTDLLLPLPTAGPDGDHEHGLRVGGGLGLSPRLPRTKCGETHSSGVGDIEYSICSSAGVSTVVMTSRSGSITSFQLDGAAIAPPADPRDPAGRWVDMTDTQFSGLVSRGTGSGQRIVLVHNGVAWVQAGTDTTLLWTPHQGSSVVAVVHIEKEVADKPMVGAMEEIVRSCLTPSGTVCLCNPDNAPCSGETREFNIQGPTFGADP